MHRTANRSFLLPLLATLALAAAGTAGAADFWLVAGPVPGGVTMPDGAVVPMWGYGLEPDSDFTTIEAVPTVPGPRLAVPPGDSVVNINLYNNLTVPTSVIIPGQIRATSVQRLSPTDPDYPSQAPEGRIWSFDSETAPGTSALYSWTAFRDGSFIYKSGTHQQVQVPMGLYGAITRDFAAGPPAQVYDGVAYDTEVVLVYSAVDPVLNAAVVGGTYGPGGTITSTLHSNPQYFLVNGQPYSTAAPIVYAGGAVGQTTLLRFVSAATDSIIPTFYNTHVQAVAEDGHPYPYPFTQYTVTLVPSKTVDVLFEPTRGGTFPVVDRTLHLTNAAAPDGGWIFKLTVTADPNQPVAMTDAYFVDEDPATPLAVAAAGVLANDSGGVGPLSAFLVQDVLHGTLVLNADGSFEYTPDTDYFGADFFLYEARDGTTASEPVAVVIRIDPVNDLPTTVADALTTFEDVPLNLPAPGLLANDVDVDNDPLIAVLLSNPANGTVGLLGSGALTYTPSADWFGVDSFTYEARDAAGSGGRALVTVTVTPVNDVPVAEVDILPMVPANQPFNLAAPGLLSNDWDPEGDLLRVVATPVFSPWHGALTLNQDGSLTYTPDPDYVGVDYFRYKINDGQLNSLAQHVWIFVNPIFYGGFEGGDLGGWSTVGQ